MAAMIEGRTYCDQCGHEEFDHYEVVDKDEAVRVCEHERCGCERWVLPT